MIAWLQKVYEKASSNPAVTPANMDSATVAHRNVSRPTAAAPQIAENRLRPRAGLIALTALTNGRAKP
jgi:hypothetical protein